MNIVYFSIYLDALFLHLSIVISSVLQGICPLYLSYTFNGIKLVIVFPYYHFNVYRICHHFPLVF